MKIFQVYQMFLTAADARLFVCRSPPVPSSMANWANLLMAAGRYSKE